MQATRTLGGKGLSYSGVGVIVAITAAFLIGAGGGYAARSTAPAAQATNVAGTVSALHQQAPDAADRNARLSLPRAAGPAGQLGDVPAGYDPNEFVGAPIRVVVPAAAQAGDDFCAVINRHKAC